MNDETADFSRFMQKISGSDLARTNLFLVRFQNLNNVINQDGVLSPLGSIELLDFNRLKDIGYNQIQKHLPSQTKAILGASASTLGVFGQFEKDGMFGLLDLFGTGYDVNRDLALMVKSVNIPATSLDTQVINTEGRPFTEVKNRTNETLRMTFYCSPDYAERIWFLTWLDGIHDQDNAIFGFQSDYAKPIEIITLDRAGVKTSTVYCTSCFPIRVGEVQLGYEQSNEIAYFEVEFALSTIKHRVTKGKQTNINQVESIGRVALGHTKAILN